MIDLTDSSSAGTGILSKVQIRRDGSSEDGLLFDVDIAFEIQTIEDAEKADKIIPGVREMFNSSETGEERRITVRSTLPDSSLHIEVINQDGETLIATPSEIRNVVFTSSGAGSIITNRFRLFGLEVESATHLLTRLGKRITLVTEKPQQVLDFKSTSKSNKPPEASSDRDIEKTETATVVTYGKDGEPKFGMLVNDPEGPFVEISNFSTLRSVPRDTIVSSINVVGPDGVNLSRQLTKYHMESRNSSCNPDWKWLILSLGERYAGTLSDNDLLIIDDSLINDAIGKASLAV